MNKRKQSLTITNNIILFVGIGFVIAGIVVAIRVLLNYRSFKEHISFYDDQNFERLATVLNGTAGLLFTLAGVIFLGYTLYQTRMEMSDTRQILNTQLAESTFFNLLKHHRELVESLNRDLEGNEKSFKDEMIYFQKALYKYVSQLNDNHFKSFTDTHFSFPDAFLYCQKVSLVKSSLAHIIILIKNKFKEDEVFYHQTLYQNLSIEEKYLIGMLISNKLEPDLDKLKFDYTPYYLKRSIRPNEKYPKDLPVLYAHPYENKRIYVPSLAITDLNAMRQTIQEASKIFIGDISLLKLESVRSILVSGQGFSENDFLPVKINYEFQNNENGTSLIIVDFFIKAISKLKEKPNEHIYELKFEYKFKDYTYFVDYPKFKLCILGIPSVGTPANEEMINIGKQFNVDKVFIISLSFVGDN